MGEKGSRRGHVLAGDVTSGGSSLVGGVGHSASTGLAGAGGRSLSTGITQVDGPVPLSCRVVKRLEWVGAFGWTIGSAWRLRYGRDVMFGRPRCLAGRTPHTYRTSGDQGQRGTPGTRIDPCPLSSNGCRLVVPPRLPCFATAKDATWILRI